MAELLRPYGLEAVSGGALGLPEPEETGDHLQRECGAEGAAAAAASGLPALADDSAWSVGDRRRARDLFGALGR